MRGVKELNVLRLFFKRMINYRQPLTKKNEEEKYYIENDSDYLYEILSNKRFIRFISRRIYEKLLFFGLFSKF